MESAIKYRINNVEMDDLLTKLINDIYF